MGTFTISIQIGDLAGSQFTQIDDVPVDTGTTYSTFPESILDQS
jgi:hypothetical protein